MASPHITNNQSILTPLPAQQGLIFGVSFRNPDSLITLYKEHFYSLFLLLYYHGQSTHKQIVARKTQKCIQSFSLKIQQHRKNCIFCKTRGTHPEQNSCKQTKLDELRIKILKYFKKETQTKSENRKVQLHSAYERECIRKASIDILQPELFSSIRDLDYFLFAKLACSILNIECKVKDFYATHIIQFCCLEFHSQSLSVFIEINDDTQTYYYIKRRSEFTCRNKLSQYDINEKQQDRSNIFGQINNLSNSSFQNLIKDQVSIEINGKHLNQTLNQNSLQSGSESESKFIDQQDQKSPEQTSYMEQSKILENISKVQLIFKKKVSLENLQSQPKIELNLVRNLDECTKVQQQNFQYDRCNSDYSEQQQEKVDEKQNFEKSMNDKAKTSESQMKMGEQSEAANRLVTNDNFLSSLPKKESFYQILQVNRFAKSGCIQSPKRQRQRKNSDTLNQKINLQDFQCSFNTFAENLDHNALLVNQSVCEKQYQSEQPMLESKTYPFYPEFLSKQQQVKQVDLGLIVPSAVNQLVNLVRSGKTSFSVAMMQKYSFEEMIEAIQKLQNQEILDSSKIFQSSHQPSSTEQKQIDFITILSAIFKEQKQQKIHEFIEKARKALSQLKNVRKTNSIKRGEELVKFPLEETVRLKKKENKQAIYTHILSQKGVQALKPLQLSQKRPQLSKSRVMSLSQYQISIQSKCLKFFSPQISKKM